MLLQKNACVAHFQASAFVAALLQLSSIWNWRVRMGDAFGHDMTSDVGVDDEAGAPATCACIFSHCLL
jgi:hypothetical protein